MSAWFNLVKKEYRMTRTFLFVLLGVMVIGGLWLMYLSGRYQSAIIMAPAALVASMAVLFPPVFMLQSLLRELKYTPNLWLHCPQPAWMLLSAKLIIGLILMAIVLLVDNVFLFWALQTFKPVSVDTNAFFIFVTEVGAYAAIGVVALSVYMSAWATLVAIVTASVRNILGRLSWLAGVAVFIIATWGMGKFQETVIFDKLTEWGLFTIKLQSLANLAPAAQDAFGGIHIYAGQIFFGILVTAAVFLLSAWMLDNKVEV